MTNGVETLAGLLTALVPLDPAGRPGGAYVECRLSIDTRRLDRAEEVEAMIEAFAPEQGWTQHMSAVRIHEVGWSPEPEAGPVLAGEYARADGSLVVRYTDGAWWLTRLCENTGGTPVLAREAGFATVLQDSTGQRLAGNRLCYRVFLRHDAQAGWQDWQARFTGFGE